MRSAEIFQRRAEECVHALYEARDGDEKVHLLEEADAWMALARERSWIDWLTATAGKPLGDPEC